MSIYQLQQCLYDYLRLLENAGPDDPRPRLSSEGYSLTDAERAAIENNDIGEIAALGVHPVIINGYCRALGYRRADYRPLFKTSIDSTKERARWQKS